MEQSVRGNVDGERCKLFIGTTSVLGALTSSFELAKSQKLITEGQSRLSVIQLLLDDRDGDMEDSVLNA